MTIIRSPPHRREASSKLAPLVPESSPTPNQEDSSRLAMQDASSQSVSSDAPQSAEPPGAVAAAIQALPIEVGTLVSPTISRPTEELNSMCKGGPGNETCHLEVKGNQQGVQCDICFSWYHALCQGIQKSAYNALKKHDVVSFICSTCKKLPNLDKFCPQAPRKDAATQLSDDSLQPNSPGQTKNGEPIQPGMVNSSVQVNTTYPMANLNDSSNSHTLTQLVMKVDNLEKILKEHLSDLSKAPHTNSIQASSSQVNHDSDNYGAPSRKETYAETLSRESAQNHLHRPTPQTPNTKTIFNSQQDQTQNQDYRMVVREELLELDERKKRRASLVIRGLGAPTAADAAVKFAEVTQSLIGEKVVLSETCRIRTDADLYRGNVHSTRQRKLILEQARHLKDSSFSQVYIKRDLTYMQRMQLQARFQQHHNHSATRNTISASIPSDRQMEGRSSLPTRRTAGRVDHPTSVRSTPEQSGPGSAPPAPIPEITKTSPDQMQAEQPMPQPGSGSAPPTPTAEVAKAPPAQRQVEQSVPRPGSAPAPPAPTAGITKAPPAQMQVEQSAPRPRAQTESNSASDSSQDNKRDSAPSGVEDHPHGSREIPVPTNRTGQGN